MFKNKIDEYFFKKRREQVVDWVENKEVKLVE